MKVTIGCYPTHYNTQWFADLLRYVGVSEDKRMIVGDWLHASWLGTLCAWVSEKNKQTMKVRIDPHDTWSMDQTLAHIILPMLKQLKDTKHGAPSTRDVDVPKYLRSTAKGARNAETENGGVDSNYFARWDYILNEMLWAFDEHVTCEEYNKCFIIHDEENSRVQGYLNIDYTALTKVETRKQNGLLLFGRYYQALWD